MRYIFYLTFLLIDYKFIQAQSNTFSKLYPLNPLLSSTFTSIEIDDNSYYIIGVGSIDAPGYPAASLFMRTNLNGEIEKFSSIIDTNNNFETWFQSLVMDHEGNLVTHGVSRNPKDSNFLSFIKYNKDGDLMLLKTFNASQVRMFEMSHCMKKNDLDEYYMTARSNPDDYNSSFFNFKLDKNGNILWKREFKMNALNCSLFRMALTKNGFIIGATVSPNSEVKNGINQYAILAFDSLGNNLWEKYSDPKEDWIGTIGGVEVNDKNEIIFFTGKGRIDYPLPSHDNFYWDWCGILIDSSINVKKATFFKSPIRLNINNINLWGSLKLKNESGYISVGQDMPDSIPHGWIVKLSDSGDSLWARHYRINYPDKGYVQFQLRNIKEDNYGNLIAIGERREFDRVGFNTQQGWMIKLDKYGCLMPGCQLVNTNQVNDNKPILETYPNPANEFISFRIFNDGGHQKYSYKLYDIEGKMVISDFGMLSEETQIIHVNELSKGIYILKVYLDNQNIKEEKITIIH